MTQGDWSSNTCFAGASCLKTLGTTTTATTVVNWWSSKPFRVDIAQFLNSSCQTTASQSHSFVLQIRTQPASPTRFVFRKACTTFSFRNARTSKWDSDRGLGCMVSYTELWLGYMAIIRLICSLGSKIGNFKDFSKFSDKNEAQKRVFREKLTLDTTCWRFGTVCERYFTISKVWFK